MKTMEELFELKKTNGDVEFLGLNPNTTNIKNAIKSTLSKEVKNRILFILNDRTVGINEVIRVKNLDNKIFVKRNGTMVLGYGGKDIETGKVL